MSMPEEYTQISHGDLMTCKGDRLPPWFQWQLHSSMTYVTFCTGHTGILSLLNLNIFGKVPGETSARWEVLILCEVHQAFFQVPHQDITKL